MARVRSTPPYKGGLRLLRAPKASDCAHGGCTGKFATRGARNNGKVIDPAHYRVHAVLLDNRFDPRGPEGTVKNQVDAHRLGLGAPRAEAVRHRSWPELRALTRVPAPPPAIGKRKADALRDAHRRVARR